MEKKEIFENLERNEGEFSVNEKYWDLLCLYFPKIIKDGQFYRDNIVEEKGQDNFDRLKLEDEIKTKGQLEGCFIPCKVWLNIVGAVAQKRRKRNRSWW